MNLCKAGLPQRAKTDFNECTKVTEFFDITSKVRNKSRYDKVFICDQPGIGGLEITEARYLQDFGPGWSFLTKRRNYSDMPE